ncbi:MAG: ribonuclease H-like domain-containing protein [Chloroflexi bacterium]|nr:ribonuclease H-like domain-containing protein [Chloroflexota bacterium]
MGSSHLLFGQDDTPGIVSVSADRAGRAVVWRREGETVHSQAVRFLNWFLVRDPQFLADLPATHLSPGDLAAGLPDLPGGLGVARLAGNNPFCYLVLTDRLPELEPILLGVHYKRTGEQVRSLAALRSEVYWRPPVEQYLTLTGRTYFKGMAYPELRRLQFDLETTGLDETRDRIFMVSVSDSTDFRACLDTAEMSERELLEAFVALVRARDPDVLENHNLFEFDIPFLIHRAAALGVRLALGRDGSVFKRSPDQVRVGERSQAFTRFTLAGREIVDTLHAVKRYGAGDRAMRYHGLKEAARYFGFARSGREYVQGAEIWSTFQVDPERVRRYGADDVAEVDELSKLLLPSTFALASMVPRPYERVATSGTGQGLVEPLLVRAYLAAGHSLPDAPASAGTLASAYRQVFTGGVAFRVVKADVASLSPSVLLNHHLAPRGDELDVFVELLGELATWRLHHQEEARGHAPGTRQRAYHDALQGAMKVLIGSFPASLSASSSLFGDRGAAAEVARCGRELLGQLLAELERRGAVLIEADADGVFFSVPEGWSEADEVRLLAEVSARLPAGARVEHEGRYRAMYSYAEKNYVLQGYDGRLRIVGSAFRSGKQERYAERFLVEAVRRLLEGEPTAIRELYRDSVAHLRARQVAVDELCVSATLTKTPEEYRRAQRREEQYEVVLSSGRAAWRPGQRVRYYQALGGRKRLVDEYADDYDVEHYAARLRTLALQRLSKALPEETLQTLLSLDFGF